MFEIVTGLPPYSSAKKIDLVCGLLVDCIVFKKLNVCVDYALERSGKGR